MERFERYCERVAGALGDLMPYACTVNEPQIVSTFGYLLGYHLPGLQNPNLWRRATRAARGEWAAVRALMRGGLTTGGHLPPDADHRARASR